MKSTQSSRLLSFLYANPGATHMEIQLGCEPFIANVTARLSDLKAQGYDIRLRKRLDGRSGWVVLSPRVTTGVPVELGL